MKISYSVLFGADLIGYIANKGETFWVIQREVLINGHKQTRRNRKKTQAPTSALADYINMLTSKYQVLPGQVSVTLFNPESHGETPALPSREISQWAYDKACSLFANLEQSGSWVDIVDDHHDDQVSNSQNVYVDTDYDDSFENNYDDSSHPKVETVKPLKITTKKKSGKVKLAPVYEAP